MNVTLQQYYAENGTAPSADYLIWTMKLREKIGQRTDAQVLKKKKLQNIPW